MAALNIFVRAYHQSFAKLSSKLCQYGFVHSNADYSLFSYRKGDVLMGLLIYVDDTELADNDTHACSQFKRI